MSHHNLSYNELQERLAKAEATLESLRRGEVDLVIGTAEPLVVRFKSLAEENERLVREWQMTFDSIEDAVWVLDAEQRVLRSNRAAERLFHRPLAEMTGKHCWEIVHGTQGPPIPECPIPRMRKSLRREKMELQAGNRWFQVSVDPVFDSLGRSNGVIHTISDITQHKEMEQTLEENRSYLKAVLDSVNDAIFVDDADTGRIIDVNQRCCEMYGYSYEEMLKPKSGS